MSKQRNQPADRMMDALDELRSFLKSLSPGPVPAEAGRTIEMLLSSCWDRLDCDDQEGMKRYKLKRMEEVRWEPPRLIFEILRHPGMAKGLTGSGKLQEWAVDIQDGTAMVARTGWCQLFPTVDEQGCNKKKGGTTRDTISY